ncbi:MAG: type II secretion system minor pseudopilin GspH [Alcanivoracaceae bacterium]|nr:type II secretion system minor pseudopilin GspH [Alcanivoracaceae bacterium]
MPISISATNSRRSLGFTLLEVLVVVTLLALLASMVVPMMGRNTETEDLDFQAKHLKDVIQQLAENSMFRGELMALRLDDTRYQPQRYNIDDQVFEPIVGNDLFTEFELPTNYLLEWTLTEQDDPGQSSLNQVAANLVTTQNNVDKDDLPQLYFFPSGEATPVTLILRDGEKGDEVKLELDAVGRVDIPTDEDELDEDE